MFIIEHGWDSKLTVELSGLIKKDDVKFLNIESLFCFPLLFD